jgi:hemoglobin
MKRLLPLFATLSLTTALLTSISAAAEPAAGAAVEEINKICPISGQPADPNITVVYEGKTYAFAKEACRAKFNADREKSLYHRLGGKAALDAAIDAFYVKMLADDRVKHYFDDVNMTRQRRKQKDFLAAAFGGPIPWKGMDLRTAHAGLGLTDKEFNAVAENLQKTLEEMKVKPELIAEVMTIAASTHDAVLNREPASK